MADVRLPEGVMDAGEHEVHHLRTMAYLIAHRQELNLDPSAVTFEIREDGSGDRIELCVAALAGAFRRQFDALDQRTRR